MLSITEMLSEIKRMDLICASPLQITQIRNHVSAVRNEVKTNGVSMVDVSRLKDLLDTLQLEDTLTVSMFSRDKSILGVPKVLATLRMIESKIGDSQ